MSGIDLGLEFGRRGTLENNLIQQNFFNVKVGINFADKWFQKEFTNKPNNTLIHKFYS